MSEDPLANAAQEWFRKGTEAMGKQNWDFAIECFGNSVKMKPDNLLFRQTRHGCIRKKYGDNGSGARMAKMKLMGVKTKIKRARSKKDWKGVSEAVEEGLVINPWDAGLNSDLSEAALELGYDDIAEYAMLNAVKADPSNMGYNQRLGYLLRDRGKYKEARKCFERIYKADPTNGEARSMMSKLDAEQTMDRGGYDKADTTQDVKSDNKPVNAYEMDRQARGMGPKAEAPGESPELDLKHAIRKDPKNVNHYIKLAELLRQDRRFPDALGVMDQAVEAVGSDNALNELREDINVDMLRDQAAQAAEKSRRRPDDERLKKKAVEFRGMLLEEEIRVMTPRVERHPNDMRLKFDLAARLRKAKQIAKAIPLLQQAVGDSRLKEDALVALGECFVAEKKLDLARRQFEKALETISGQDKPDAFKTAHYFIARIHEKAGKTDLAENHYNDILAVDYSYRDVLQRLEKLQGAEGIEGGLD